MRARWVVLVAAAVSVSAGFVLMQATSEPSYPNGDIDLIVPAGAGETTDTVARAVAPCLADELGVGVVVRNVPGEHGVLGSLAIADGRSDGRTLMVSSAGPTVVTPYLLPARPYVLNEFSFLGVVRTAPVVLFTAADSGVDSADSLLAAAKGRWPIGHGRQPRGRNDRGVHVVAPQLPGEDKGSPRPSRPVRT